MTIDIILLSSPPDYHIHGRRTCLPMERAPIFVENYVVTHGESHGQKFWLAPLFDLHIVHFTLPLVSRAHLILRKAAERPRAIQSYINK